MKDAKRIWVCSAGQLRCSLARINCDITIEIKYLLAMVEHGAKNIDITAILNSGYQVRGWGCGLIGILLSSSAR